MWMLLFVLASAMLIALIGLVSARPPQQEATLRTLAVLGKAEQALLAYAMQPLGTTACDMNCPRPGDLPCPDRNNDGVAESSCSGPETRLGRLPWKTLGLGDLRDASGERLWYAVSTLYKNNPRLLPLNAETPGSWSILQTNGVWLDATQGQGVVAVLIAPMQPITRRDGWQQQRNLPNNPDLKDYLDMTTSADNASAIENSPQGFAQSAPSPNFNDVVWPMTASRMHRMLQQQVLFELKRALACTSIPCPVFPAAADMGDTTCLGRLTLVAGSCLALSTPIGRLPLDAQGHWPLAANHLLDGDARHHWFQQNGWREQVLYRPQIGDTLVVVAGEPLPGQSRQNNTEKSMPGQYLESATLQLLGAGSGSATTSPSNDTLDKVPLP